MFTRALITAAVMVSVSAFSAAPVFADQLTLGGDGQATFTGTGSSSNDVITITTSGNLGGCAIGATCIGSDTTGTFESPTGTQTFAGASWSFSVPQTAPLLSLLSPSVAGSSYSYAIDQNGGQTAAFIFSGGGGDTVTGSIDWTSLTQVGTGSAYLNGVLIVSSVTGTGTNGATFAADFPQGYTLPVDYMFSMGGQALSSLIGTGNSISGTASSGEVPAAPEPTTLVLYGAGLLTLGSYVRRRRRHGA